jgi:hypothetical protein
MHPAASSASAEIARIHYSEDYIGSIERVKIDVFDVTLCHYGLYGKRRKKVGKKRVQKFWERDGDFAGLGNARFAVALGVEIASRERSSSTLASALVLNR